jgi:hypothetical protein
VLQRSRTKAVALPDRAGMGSEPDTDHQNWAFFSHPATCTASIFHHPNATVQTSRDVLTACGGLTVLYLTDVNDMFPAQNMPKLSPAQGTVSAPRGPSTLGPLKLGRTIAIDESRTNAICPMTLTQAHTSLPSARPSPQLGPLHPRRSQPEPRRQKAIRTLPPCRHSEYKDALPAHQNGHKAFA